MRFSRYRFILGVRFIRLNPLLQCYSSCYNRQLTASDINFAIVRPLVMRYAKLKNMAVVYACLVVRSHFIEASDSDLAYSNVMVSRAMMCEILAMKLVRTFANDKLELAAVL